MIAVLWAVALAWVLVACRAVPSDTRPPKQILSVQDQLVTEFGARVLPYPQDVGELTALKKPDLLVFLATNRSTPIGGLTNATRAQLRRYVEQGGRMLLLGFATRLVHEIGIEPQAPDRFAVYRWGDSDKTLLGEYRFGLRLESPQAGELVEGLEEVEEQPGAYHLGGGEMVSVQSCHWERTRPANGRVVGRLFRVRDGEAKALESAVLTAWGVGRGGRILAYGSLPEPWRPDPAIHRNACQFLRNAVHSLCSAAKQESTQLRVVVFADSKPSAPLPKALPPLAERQLPGAAVVPHWGWQVPLSNRRDGGTPAPQTVIQQVLVPSWRAGADLLDLHLWDPERGYPLAWDAQDPLRRPRTYQGGAFLPEWGLPALRRLAGAAHERSMLVQTWMSPDPTRLGPPVEILACTKWLARELLDVRRLGKGALDGLGVHTWFDDRDGYTRRVVERYQPAVHGYCTGIQPPFFPGFVGTLNANHGRPRGLNAAGLSSRWRNAFPPPDHMAGMLDCQVRQPSVLRWGEQAHGGGSYGDWIVTQVNDFARARMGQGAAMWWQAFNDRTTSPIMVDYVHGLSMQPIKAAVAGHLLATGKGGYRDLVRGFVDKIQSGFGAESEYPAETPFLQNNHFRLHGSGGALLLDPTGLACFRKGERQTRVISRGFMRSSWRAVQPRVEGLEVTTIDFILGHPRGENGYGPLLRIGEKERGPGLFPAMLAHDEPGRWPRKVEVALRTPPGHYQLELVLRSSSGRGIVELQREGEAVRLLAFHEKAGSKLHKVAFPVAVSGLQTWSLEVLGGGRVAIDGCRLIRGGPTSVYAVVPTEVRIHDRAGHLAELVEHTAAPEFQERRTIRTIADLPGFVLTIDYDWVRARPQVVREFELPRHRRLGSTNGQSASMLRKGFVLRSSDAAVPNLAVIPVELPRYHHFEFQKGKLRLTGFPRSNERVRVGFVFLRGGQTPPVDQLERVVMDVLEPLTLELGRAGRARIVPRARTPYPRVVRVINANKTPYLVREGGTWLGRGAQRSRLGGDWLLVYHQDQVPVDIVNGDRFVTGIHPGPGSLYSLALADLGEGSVTARVLQTGPFLTAPSVVMDRPFTEATVDGKPWRYVCGRTVFLPRARGAYRVRVWSRAKAEAEGEKETAEVPVPALARTSAHVQSCRYDATNQVLEVFTLPLPGEPEGSRDSRDYTAWFTGGTPVRVDGGDLVPASEFTYRREEDARAAAEAGVIVRFRPGLLRLYYRDPRALAAPEGR